MAARAVALAAQPYVLMNVPVKTRRFARGLEVDLHTCREGTPRTAIHAHDFVELGYVVRGNAVHHIGRRREFAMLAGDAFLIGRELPHFYADVHDLEVTYLLLGSSLFHRSVAGMQLFEAAGRDRLMSADRGSAVRSAFHHLPPGTSHEIEAMLSRVRTEMENRDWGYAALIRALVVELFVLLGRSKAACGDPTSSSDVTDANQARIDAVRAFIEEHYAEDLRLADLARCACLQSQYLCRVFKKLAGMTMIEYLTRVRVRRACELLAKTPAAVTDICFRVGFNDLSHFIRTFRKTVGATPTDYRRKSR